MIMRLSRRVVGMQAVLPRKNGAPAEAQRLHSRQRQRSAADVACPLRVSGFGGERRSKGAGAVFAEGGNGAKRTLRRRERLSEYEATSQFSVLTPDINIRTPTDAPVSGVPAKRMFCGERRCSKVSKARRLRRDERYGACTDEGVLRGQIFESRAERGEPNLPPKSTFAYFCLMTKVGLRSKYKNF